MLLLFFINLAVNNPHETILLYLFNHSVIQLIKLKTSSSSILGNPGLQKVGGEEKQKASWVLPPLTEAKVPLDFLSLPSSLTLTSLWLGSTGEGKPPMGHLSSSREPPAGGRLGTPSPCLPSV